jgi:DNA helicase-4
MTVHRAKGQEADYVLLVDLISGVYGFPAVQSDDPILNLVLASSGPEDLLMHGEERRLFYVAMTRAKQEVHIITDVPNPSIFVDEVLSYGT